MSEPGERELGQEGRGPLRELGAIQPHGALLVLSRDSTVVAAASESCLDHLGVSAPELLGEPLSTLFAGEDLDRLKSALGRPSRRPERLRLRSRRRGNLLDVLVHDGDGWGLVELEPAEAAPPVDHSVMIERVAGAMAVRGEPPDLCRRAAEELARLSGFERVAICQFEEDWRGRVVAEVRVADGVQSLLGERLPGLGLSEQARRRRELEPLRAVRDVRASPSPVLARTGGTPGELPFELSRAVLRVPSLTERELLTGLGMSASLSLPLLRDGRLWGLVVCHHRAPLQVASPLGSACELIASVLALQLSDLERASAVRERDSILGAVANELRSPLSTIRLTAGLLLRQRSELPAEAIHKLARIDGAAGRMGVLVDEIVDEGRVERGQALSGQRGRCDLVELARRKAEEFAQASPRHEVRVETAFAAVTGEWDAQAIGRVLDNLIGNAVKYSPEGGTVRILVDVTQEGREAVVAVVDEGIGIPAAELGAVFDPFRRASNVPGITPGTGLGLSVTRRIVAEHGGTVDVASTEGSGSMFMVRLPRVPPVSERVDA